MGHEEADEDNTAASSRRVRYSPAASFVVLMFLLRNAGFGGRFHWMGGIDHARPTCCSGTD